MEEVKGGDEKEGEEADEDKGNAFSLATHDMMIGRRNITIHAPLSINLSMSRQSLAHHFSLFYLSALLQTAMQMTMA